jgi:GDSL-like Lipase/Acylhydrolase family
MTSPSPTDRPRRRRVRLVACAVVVAVAGAALAFAGIQFDQGSGHHSVVAAAKLLHSPSSQTSQTSTAALPDHDVLFVGASYTAGLGASPQTDGYAYVIGREPGWHAQVSGVSGSGFLNPGPRGDQTFAERIAHLPTRPRPELVVFQGGRNDVNYPSAQLRSAAIETAALTRKRYAGAEIVFLGPIPAHVPAPPDQVAVADTLRSAAASCKAIFVDPIAQGWITPGNENGYTGHVPAHPDNNGYAYIAQRLLGDLQGLVRNHRNT